MVEIGRGCFECVDYIDGKLVIEGWLLLPGHEMDGFDIAVGEKLVAQVPASLREDVEEHMFVPADTRVWGFSFEEEFPEEPIRDWTNVCATGTKAGERVARVDILYCVAWRPDLPLPPEHMRYRVTMSKSPFTWWLSSLKTGGEFLTAMQEVCDPRAPLRLLDWGCGSGRSSMILAAHLSNLEVHGADIDGEAIRWCNENLAAGRYTVIEPEPPMPFEDESFDVVLGYSVFTHLQAKHQRMWLEELRRIVRPGGHCFVSVHGDFAADLALRERSDAFLETGFTDSQLDPILDGVAPEGYYRAVFQTREYTQREWSRIIDVVGYKERWMSNFQDLVILRK